MYPMLRFIVLLFFVYQGLYYTQKLFFPNYTGLKYTRNKLPSIRLPKV